MRNFTSAQGLKVPGADNDSAQNEPSCTRRASQGAAVTKQRTSFQDLCYGIPVDLIAAWCCVDIQSARHFKAGTRSPGNSARKLFALHLEGAVLPAEWQGFSFRGGKMWDPYGKELTHGLLRAYPIALQLMREWARGDEHRSRTLDDILNAPGLALPSPPLRIADEQRESAAPRRRAETIRRRTAATPDKFASLSPRLRAAANAGSVR